MPMYNTQNPSPANTETEEELRKRFRKPNSTAPAVAPTQEPAVLSPDQPAPVGVLDMTSTPGTDTKVSTLEEKVKRSISAPRPVDEAGVKAALDEKATLLRDMKAVGIDTTSIDTDLKDAKEAYRNKESRNEMLSLLQMVSNSISQYAAASWGKKNKQFINPMVNPAQVDYERRTDRALDERKMAQGDWRDKASVLEKRATLEEKLQGNKIASADQKVNTAETVRGQNVSLHNAQLSAFERQESDIARDAETDKRLKDAEKRADVKTAGQIFDDAQKEEEQLKGSEKYILSKIGESKDKKKSAAAVATLYAAVPEEQKEAADQIMKPIEEGDKSETHWYGDKPDPARQANDLGNLLVTPIREKLKKAQERKSRAQAIMEGTNPSPGQPAAAGVKMLDPKTGITGTIPLDKVEAARAKGLKEVQ